MAVAIARPKLEGNIAVGEDRRIGFAEFGAPQGRAVFWLHGTPGARRQIPTEARVYAEHHNIRLIGVDRPGIGASTPHQYETILAFADDLRPSWLPKLMAHGGGTTAEFLVPGILVLVADGHPWRWFLIGFMVLFHLNILSNLPMGVPLEWNVFFIFSLCYLFGHYGAITATDLRSPLLLAIVIAVVAVVIMGNLLPEKISFLPAMRYYAGNWATSIWCFRGDAEATMETSVVKSSALVVNQLAKLYDGATAEIMTDKVAAFRAMHTHGRALNGLLPRALDDEAHYRIREGEIVAGPLVGWNFGEGHLHNEQLVAAVQRRCNFADGDLRVIILEGQPIHVQKQWYRIVDAKTGLFEAGYVTVEDMLSRQPWPEPGDEFPVHVTTQRGTPSKP
ncbi:hypothetical protein GR255_17990 [Mycobacterium tuberculosis]|nr:hypothetical protein [Mycobacterium tuberculosis]